MSNVPNDWGKYFYRCPDCNASYHASEGHYIEDCFGSIEKYADANFSNYIVLDSDTFVTFDGENILTYEWDECIEKVHIDELTFDQKLKLIKIIGE